MGSVNVATKHNGLAPFAQLLAFFQKRIVKGQFEGYAAVIAAAVILDDDQEIVGLADSKKLSERRRQSLALEIQRKSISWGIGRAEIDEIDAIASKREESK